MGLAAALRMANELVRFDDAVNLDTDRVTDPTEVLDVSTIDLPGSISDPGRPPGGQTESSFGGAEISDDVGRAYFIWNSKFYSRFSFLGRSNYVGTVF